MWDLCASRSQTTWVYIGIYGQWVMSHMWMSHVTHVNESCHTYEWVMSHTWMLHTRARIYGQRVRACAAFTCVTWLIHTCDMTHSHEWHDSFMCVTWLMHDMTHSCVWHDSCMSATRGICMCDVTHWFVSQDAFTCVTWLIHMCVLTHSYLTNSYLWHDSHVHVTWLIHTCDTTRHVTCVAVCCSVLQCADEPSTPQQTMPHTLKYVQRDLSSCNIKRN